MKKTVLIVVGPTASGKTRFAIELAQKHNTEIISADSRQCYKELNIGVARPSIDELARVKHHFIATHSIVNEVTAADFEEYALSKSKELFENHNEVVMVGGTGLYIKAFCEGLDEVPEIDPGIRERIRENYDHRGLGWLQEQIRDKDPLFFSRGEIRNPQRVMRALEVVESTGRSLFSFHNNDKKTRNFEVRKIGLDPGKEQLHHNINIRVDKMMESGLLEEVKNLYPYKHLNALRTVGYQELFDYLDKKISLDEAVALVKQNTRQYAKRQLTWFRKDKTIEWISKI